jgi:hypothetical protein
LPHGSDGAVLRLSAFVTLRLTTADGNDALLSDPDFADVASWPDRVAQMTFAVQAGAATLPATVVSAAPSAQLWAALFPPADTAVHSHQPEDYSKNPRSSFSVLATHQLLKSLHTETGKASPGSPPAWLGDIRGGPYLELLGLFHIPRDRARDSGLGGIPASQLTPSQQLTQLVAFYARTDDGRMTHVPLPTPAQLKARFDVHAILSSLGDHPSLLRPAGLVIDLTIPAAGIPPEPAPMPVRVLPTWQPQSPGMAAPASPGTMAIWDGTGFFAASARGLIDDGYLRLEPDADGVSRFGLVEVDVDGGVLKAVNFANNIEQLQAQTDVEIPANAGLPALRSGGWSLIYDGRAEDLASTFQSNASTETALSADPAQVELYAENLVRGYRLDIDDLTGGGWRSLCRRIVSYHFANGPDLDASFKDLSDEGFVQLGVTSAAKDPGQPAVTPNDTLYIHESVARWDGWSLAARKPGLAVSHRADPSAAPERGDQSSGTSASLETTAVAAPNSLPRLRFGHGYRIRARVVDLAGDSPAYTDGTATHAIPVPDPGAVYHRYEPVITPAVILQSPLGTDHPGESLRRMVIRSYNSDISKDADAAGNEAVRHIAPPRTSVAMAETLGMLDGPDGRPQAALYPELVARDAGQLPLDRTPTPPVPIEPSDSFALPYLPDPLARGAAFRDLPGTASPTRTVLRDNGLETSTLPGIGPRPGSATLIGYEGPWPDMAPFRFVLAEGDGPPEWDPANHLLRVFLPKSAVATTPVSSFLHAGELKLMGVWEWLREAVEPGPNLASHDVDAQGVLDELVGLISELSVEGGLWQLTPARDITLVHAVQQPLGRPAVTALAAGRLDGATSAYLTGNIQIDGASTDKVTLQAAWTDPVDDATQPAPSTVDGHGVATELSIDDPAGGAVLTGSTVVGNYDATSGTLVLGAGSPANSPLHELHDTKHHTISYTPTSASRFRDYFPPSVPGGTSRTGLGMTTKVPASRRPDPPLLRYVLPSFGWQRDERTNLRASRRQGGLRVLLDRPWYSSGEGELLGVITWPGALPEDRQDQLSHYVSRMGADPVYASSQAVNTVLDATSFGLSTAREFGLTLTELPGDTVDVAGHAVHFDAGRGLWTADLTLDADAVFHPMGAAYHPWVRLALVRYQPDAIADAKLSRVVLADFAALPMDRGLLLTYDPYLPDVISVTVSGHSYTATASEAGSDIPGGSIIEVTVEQRVAEVADEVLGWQPVAVPITADTDVTADEVLWHGHVTLPTGREHGQYRVVVSEYEWLLTDPPPIIFRPPPFAAGGPAPADAGAASSAPAPQAAGTAAPEEPAGIFGPQPAKRLVYTDTMVV